MATDSRNVVFKARENRKVGVRGFSLYERDFLMVDELAEFLGCSRSEAVRTAIRNLYAALLGEKSETLREGV